MGGWPTATWALDLDGVLSLVLSGVTDERELDGLAPAPDAVAADLGVLVM